MNNLLSAGFARLRKNKIFYIILGVIVLYCTFIYLSQYLNMKKYGFAYHLDPMFSNFMILMAATTAVFVSLFTGTEYSDGTIRNKLVIGHSRICIYLSSLIISISAGTLMILAGYAVGVFLGIPLFGSFQTPFPQTLFYLFLGVLIGISYVSIFHLIAMLISSKANSAVVCLLVGFGLLFLGIYLLTSLAQPREIIQAVLQDGKQITEYVENPTYLTGRKREIYQFILDILPSGQSLQIFNESVQHPIRMLLSSLLTPLAAGCLGSYLFSKKDIK